jgi:hypothetical protein
MTPEAVRSVATLAKARRRRPLPAMAGHLRNVANGLGDRSVDADCRVHIEKRLAE